MCRGWASIHPKRRTKSGSLEGVLEEGWWYQTEGLRREKCSSPGGTLDCDIFKAPACFSRRQLDLPWALYLESCQTGKGYNFPFLIFDLRVLRRKGCPFPILPLKNRAEIHVMGQSGPELAYAGTSDIGIAEELLDPTLLPKHPSSFDVEHLETSVSSRRTERQVSSVQCFQMTLE